MLENLPEMRDTPAICAVCGTPGVIGITGTVYCEAHALYERLAAIEHARWADWQRWMHAQGTRNPDGSLTLPAALVERWERQIATRYEALSEPEKQSDRDQVARYWPLIRRDGA